ncbi:MAG: hypothetical protein FJ388_18445 [Verrucomicrobia bacterium]|nr:hypothetical protein [Verrucomicrobiota bacterium]
MKARPGDVTGLRLRVLPLSWFYEDDPPCRPSKPTPKLIVGLKGKRGAEVPSLFCDDRFFVKLSDIARVLKQKVEQDMFAPIHQTLTFLGYPPTYDLRRAKDGASPRVVVTVER